MAQAGQRDFVKYTFYKVAADWRRLPSSEKERSKREFTDVLAEFADRIDLSSYSLVATRGDVDFLLWKVSPTLEAIDQLMAQLNRTELGSFLYIAAERLLVVECLIARDDLVVRGLGTLRDVLAVRIAWIHVAWMLP